MTLQGGGHVGICGELGPPGFGERTRYFQQREMQVPLGGTVDYTAGLYYFYQSIGAQGLTTYGPDAAPILLGTAVALSQETGEVLGSGELTVADNHVDASTGTVAMKARFDNPTRRLWPWQRSTVYTGSSSSQAASPAISAHNNKRARVGRQRELAACMLKSSLTVRPDPSPQSRPMAARSRRVRRASPTPAT